MDSHGLGDLIYNLPTTTKKHVRYIEKCYFKLCKQKSIILFNETCLREKKNIYIYMCVCVCGRACIWVHVIHNR